MPFLTTSWSKGLSKCTNEYYAVITVRNVAVSVLAFVMGRGGGFSGYSLVLSTR